MCITRHYACKYIVGEGLPRLYHVHPILISPKAFLLFSFTIPFYPHTISPFKTVPRRLLIVRPFLLLSSIEMDGKRHPSSFQQLEKLGEGTYATVSDWRPN